MTIVLSDLVSAGESQTLELKRSTGELREIMQSLCAFANGAGGRVIVGVKPDGTVVGQAVSEQTFHELAAAIERFEPPLFPEIDRVPAGGDRVVLVLRVPALADSVPFTWDGRAWERVENTTRRMSQDRYEQLLADRAHGRRRWENQEAEEVTIRELDREEVLRVVDAARAAGRLTLGVGRNVPDLLDRLGVRRRRQILRAAVVLFGKQFLPDYPQCELRMARFRGTDKTEFLDQRHVRAPAFKLLEEAELFCQRHFPLPGRVEPDRLQRVDRPAIPPEAMRELLVNALIHRDYAIAGGAVSLAIFDDRVEVWSAGRFPTGITPAALTRDHPSVQRNPIIAEVFHRAGLIEKWGRGTNRVGEMCRAAGLRPPTFEEVAGAALVTVRANLRPLAPAADSTHPGVDSRVESRVETRVETPFEQRVLEALAAGPRSRSELAQALGLTQPTGQLQRALAALLAHSRIAYTVPDKPTSRLQRFRRVEPS